MCGGGGDSWGWSQGSQGPAARTLGKARAGGLPGLCYLLSVSRPARHFLTALSTGRGQGPSPPSKGSQRCAWRPGAGKPGVGVGGQRQRGGPSPLLPHTRTADGGCPCTPGAPPRPDASRTRPRAGSFCAPPLPCHPHPFLPRPTVARLTHAHPPAPLCPPLQPSRFHGSPACGLLSTPSLLHHSRERGGAAVPRPSAQGWGREWGRWASWRRGPPPASTVARLIPRQAHSPGTILESSLLDQALGFCPAAQSGLGVVSGRGSLRADGPLCSPCPSPQPPRGACPASLCPGPLSRPSHRSPAPLVSAAPYSVLAPGRPLPSTWPHPWFAPTRYAALHAFPCSPAPFPPQRLPPTPFIPNARVLRQIPVTEFIDESRASEEALAGRDTGQDGHTFMPGVCS